MRSRMAFLRTQTNQLRWPMRSHQSGLAKICALNMSESRELYNSWSMEVKRYGRGYEIDQLRKMVLTLGIDITILGFGHHGAL